MVQNGKSDNTHEFRTSGSFRRREHRCVLPPPPPQSVGGVSVWRRLSRWPASHPGNSAHHTCDGHNSVDPGRLSCTSGARSRLGDRAKCNWCGRIDRLCPSSGSTGCKGRYGRCRHTGGRKTMSSHRSSCSEEPHPGKTVSAGREAPPTASCRRGSWPRRRGRVGSEPKLHPADDRSFHTHENRSRIFSRKSHRNRMSRRTSCPRKDPPTQKKSDHS